MPLKPADVHNVVFSKSPIGKRGYHEDEVDAFLDLVEADLARLMKENNELRTQIEQLTQQPHTPPVDTEKTPRPLRPPQPVMATEPPIRQQTPPGGDHNVHAAKVLSLAQEMADRLTEETKTQADAMLSKARATSEQLLSDARARAETMVTEARTRTETMLNDTRTQAETLEGQSRDKAAALERDATRKHTEILAALNQEKNTLEKKIDELRGFEREYRTNLKTHLHSQLQELDKHGSAAPAHPTCTRPQDPVTSGSTTRPQTRH
jgi:DivIVA domain-containing protein